MTDWKNNTPPGSSVGLLMFDSEGRTYNEDQIAAIQQELDRRASAPQGGGEACNCPGEGKLDPALHAPNCPARTAPPSAPAPVAGYADLRAALDDIGGLCRALRQGGPAPEDLQGLSDALQEAVDIAHAALAQDRASQAAAPSAPVGVEAIKSAIAELDALRNAMFKTYAAAANGADKAKLTRLIEAERDAYESHYSLPKLQEALAQQPAADDAEQLAACREDWAAVCTAIGERDGGHMDPSEVVAWIEERKQPAAVDEAISMDAHKATLASLVAAVSLLRRGGRKAAPSDTMFNMMLADYEKAIEASRIALTAQHQEPGEE